MSINDYARNARERYAKAATNIDEAIAGLRALNGGQRDPRREAISRLRPEIEAAIARGASQKMVLDVLAANGCELSESTLRKWRRLETESLKAAMPPAASPAN